MDVYRDERILSVALLIITTFLYINVSSEVGTLYAIFSLIYWVTVISHKYTGSIPITSQKTNILSSTAVSIVILAVWVVLSSLILNFFVPSITFSLLDESMFEYLRQFTQVPVLSTNPTIKFVVYGIMIPIIETTFFLSFVLLFWCKLLNIQPMWYPISSKNFLKMLYVCVLIGVSGSIFHFTVRMMSDYALAIDFLFFFMSSLVVFKFRRLLESMGVHIGVNSLVLLVGMGV